jgi:hypothetical protein
MLSRGVFGSDDETIERFDGFSAHKDFFSQSEAVANLVGSPADHESSRGIKRNEVALVTFLPT